MIDHSRFLNSTQFRHILNFSPVATAVHIGEEATIEFANDAMQAIWGRGSEVMGKGLVEAMPELKGQPFLEMFAQVWREGTVISGKDTPAELLVNGLLSTFYFDFEYRAVKDETGRVIAVLHTATDVTERYLNRKKLEEAIQIKEILSREQSLNEELATTNEELAATIEELNATNEELYTSQEKLSVMNQELESLVEYRVKTFRESEERFRSMADHTDVLISVSDQFGRRTYFNKAWSELTGRTANELFERGYYDLIHDLDREMFIHAHIVAFKERVSYTHELRILGSDKSYRWLLKKGTPRFLDDGTFVGYISSSVDITGEKRDELRLQQMNFDLAASNEELSSLNEELAATIEELASANDELQLTENRFRNLIKQAPVAICVIRAPDLIVTDVNDGYLTLVGKSAEQFKGHTIWEAISEVADAYAPILLRVIETGVAFHATEHELMLLRNGVTEAVYVDFVYEPVRDAGGRVISLMIVGNDVTDKVLARRRIEHVEESSRLAIEAAEIGTYEYQYADQSLTSSARFNEIFGLTGNVSRQQILASYHPLDAGLSDQAHAIAKETGKLFYETRLLHPDGSTRWVRIQGNVHYEKGGELKKLLGTVIDITDFKQLQQQKDDFISIASHELKTPITTLKASLQLLERMKANPTEKFPKLIEQCSRSMDKITELVEDLLNVTKIKEGHIVLNKRDFRVDHIIEECYSQTMHQGSHQLVVEGSLDIRINADENRIEQVLINFINNAIKYAPESKILYLTIEKLAGSVKFALRDTGAGIPADKLPHLFDRYFRADQSGAQVSGLGLGLYICSDIIKRHGGEIGVDSMVGKGTTFWFTIPATD
jgi:PAS domain S-box-containing protein